MKPPGHHASGQFAAQVHRYSHLIWSSNPMIKRIAQEKHELSVPSTPGLPVEASKELSATPSIELKSHRSHTWRKSIPRLVMILVSIVAFVIAVQANVINLKNCLYCFAFLIVLVPILRRRRKR
jgi:hypothetical protein